MTSFEHTPVLLAEVIDGLALHAHHNVIDATIGGGGHAAAIVEKTSPDGKLLGSDLDPYAVAAAQERLAAYTNRIQIIKTSYVHIFDHLDFFAGKPVHAILADLGMSSPQVDDPERGFSFEATGELAMQYGQEHDLRAHDILMQSDADELAMLFKTYGDERFAKRIAREIVAVRQQEPITGAVLKGICEKIYAKAFRKSSTTHPATRVWQALRIATNHEFDNIKAFIPRAVQTLQSGGRLAIITFHSAEDRLVKQILRSYVKAPPPDPHSPLPEDFVPTARLITRKAIQPTAEEIQKNPRSRSAQLRIIEKL